MHAAYLVAVHLQFEVFLWNLPGGTEENYIKPKSGYPISRPGFESRMPRYEAGVLTA
jgi:hypothetical protein